MRTFVAPAALLAAAFAAPILPAAADPASEPAPQLADAEQTAARKDQQGLESIVVTARRRTENAEEVPIALSVLSGSALADTGTYTLTQLQHEVPNTVNYESNPRNSSIAIRGIGITSAQDGLDTSVAVNVDNVYLGRPGMALDDLIDIDQVEVLRGPQGTLFGRNSSAGALNITTARPSFTPGATVEVSGGDYGYNQQRFTVTGPLVDGEIAGSLTGYNTLRDGVTRNTLGPADNSIGRQGLRVQLLFTPSDDLTIRLISEFSQERDTCCVAVIRNILPASISKAPAALAAAGWDPQASLDEVSINSPQYLRTRQGGSSAEIDWNLGAVTLTSISAYRFWDFNPLQDSDGTPLDILQVNAARTEDWQASQEFRLASSGNGPVQWQTGVYLFHQKLDDQYILNQYGANASAYYSALAGRKLVYGTGAQYLDYVHTAADSIALFGQATWQIDDQWSATGGVRYTHDRRDGTANSAVNGVIPASVTPKIDVDTAIHGDNVSGTGSLTYKITPESIAYATFANGYKAAGLNLDSAVPASGLFVKPEVENNFELGLKQTLLDRHLQLNLDGYWTLLSNYQANIAPLNGAKSYLTNIGDIRARGFEFEARYLPVDDLTLSVNGSYNDATYTSYRQGQCPVEVTTTTVCDLTGKRVYMAPRWIANFTGEYDRDLADNIQGYAIAQYSQTSGFYGTADDSRYAWQGQYGLANLRLGARFGDGGQYDASFWVNNLFDKQYFTQLGATAFGFVAGELGAPRTFGVTLRAAW
jgi:iron complex outermembrane receptor protein